MWQDSSRSRAPASTSTPGASTIRCHRSGSGDTADSTAPRSNAGSTHSAGDRPDAAERNSIRRGGRVVVAAKCHRRGAPLARHGTDPYDRVTAGWHALTGQGPGAVISRTEVGVAVVHGAPIRRRQPWAARTWYAADEPSGTTHVVALISMCHRSLRKPRFLVVLDVERPRLQLERSLGIG
jgi:hypothetical protein